MTSQPDFKKAAENIDSIFLALEEMWLDGKGQSIDMFDKPLNEIGGELFKKVMIDDNIEPLNHLLTATDAAAKVKMNRLSDKQALEQGLVKIFADALEAVSQSVPEIAAQRVTRRTSFLPL